MGKVYLARDEYGYYKLGVSVNPKRRKKQHQTGNPSEIELIFEFKSSYPYKVETALKNGWSMYHERGEWFNLPIDQVNGFLKNCQLAEDNYKVLKYYDNKYI